MTKRPQLRISVICCLMACLSAAPARAEQLFKLTASDAAALDFFGGSVALSGNKALIGSVGDDVPGEWSGSAYVFDTSTGQQLRKLEASDASNGDRFGSSVALNGSTALIGAPSKDDFRGSVYVFNASTGQQIRKLEAGDGAAKDAFGQAVAMSANLAIVGAFLDNPTGDGSPYDGRGAAYIFDVNTGQQIRKLTASDAAANDRFGASVALSGDLALVGAFYDGGASGSAYLFDVTTGQQLFKFTASDAAEGAQFGVSVAISGNIAIVGALYADNFRGAAYVFDVTTGQQLFKLVSSDVKPGDVFGNSVALSGNIAAIGAGAGGSPYQSGNGSAYLFDVISGQQIAKITASDGAIADGFGGKVALDGNVALIAAGATDDHGNASGSAYLFDVTVPEPSTFVLSAMALLPITRRRRGDSSSACRRLIGHR